MRHFALVLLFIVALPATAEAPTARLRYKCDGEHLMLEVTVPKAGSYYFQTPAALCGPSV
jgi:YD repeat-containing protein